MPKTKTKTTPPKPQIEEISCQGCQIKFKAKKKSSCDKCTRIYREKWREIFHTCIYNNSEYIRWDPHAINRYIEKIGLSVAKYLNDGSLCFKFVERNTVNKLVSFPLDREVRRKEDMEKCNCNGCHFLSLIQKFDYIPRINTPKNVIHPEIMRCVYVNYQRILKLCKEAIISMIPSEEKDKRKAGPCSLLPESKHAGVTQQTDLKMHDEDVDSVDLKSPTPPDSPTSCGYTPSATISPFDSDVEMENDSKSSSPIPMNADLTKNNKQFSKFMINQHLAMLKRPKLIDLNIHRALNLYESIEPLGEFSEYGGFFTGLQSSSRRKRRKMSSVSVTENDDIENEKKNLKISDQFIKILNQEKLLSNKMLDNIYKLLIKIYEMVKAIHVHNLDYGAIAKIEKSQNPSKNSVKLVKVMPMIRNDLQNSDKLKASNRDFSFRVKGGTTLSMFFANLCIIDKVLDSNFVQSDIPLNQMEESFTEGALKLLNSNSKGSNNKNNKHKARLFNRILYINSCKLFQELMVSGNDNNYKKRIMSACPHDFTANVCYGLIAINQQNLYSDFLASIFYLQTRLFIVRVLFNFDESSGRFMLSEGSFFEIGDIYDYIDRKVGSDQEGHFHGKSASRIKRRLNDLANSICQLSEATIVLLLGFITQDTCLQSIQLLAQKGVNINEVIYLPNNFRLNEQIHMLISSRHVMGCIINYLKLWEEVGLNNFGFFRDL